MGYFFRPICPLAHYAKNEEVLVMLAKNMDAPNNIYSLISHEGRQDAMWRWWGCFVSDPHYKKFINKLFVVYHDPRHPDDDYNGATIWRRRFGKKGFNKKFDDGFGQSDLNVVWAELIALVKADRQLWDPTTYSDEKTKEFVSNLKQSLKFIMFSKYDDYHAY
tara:strand:+ start:318 stop:806 length:489 start_codon:yes stop_codon:yes gene_type:complete